MARGPHFRTKVRIGQVVHKRSDPTVEAVVYQVWRKSDQAQLKLENGGKPIYTLRMLEKTWYCADWYAYDPTKG